MAPRPPADWFIGRYENLSYRERRVIEMRYGLHGEEPQTRRAIAAVFNVKPERIRHIGLKAIAQCRER